MGTVNATARGENDTTKEATLMDMASVTAMAGVHSKGMERLREVCDQEREFAFIERLLVGNSIYQDQSAKCTCAFNRLKSTLDNDQMELLMDYEESTAKRDEIIIDILMAVKMAVK